jgi:hypothetical protein
LSTITEPTWIRLEVACPSGEECSQFAWPLYRQLASGRYDVCSTMVIPHPENWRSAHRTARKRVARAQRLGYRAELVEREEYVLDIYRINTSKPERQGRQMTNTYRDRPDFAPLPEYPCARHAVRTYGVLSSDDVLVAYLWLYRSGELALVSQILGHADHLEAGVMYLLWQRMVEHEYDVEPEGVIVYNRHDSGTDGLRFYKERVGLLEQHVEWCA